MWPSIWRGKADNVTFIVADAEKPWSVSTGWTCLHYCYICFHTIWLVDDSYTAHQQGWSEMQHLLLCPLCLSALVSVCEGYSLQLYVHPQQTTFRNAFHLRHYIKSFVLLLLFLFAPPERDRHECEQKPQTQSHLPPLWAASPPAGPRWTWARQSCPAHFHPAAGRSRCGGRCLHGPSAPDGSPVPSPGERPDVDE